MTLGHPKKSGHQVHPMDGKEEEATVEYISAAAGSVRPTPFGGATLDSRHVSIANESA